MIDKEDILPNKGSDEEKIEQEKVSTPESAEEVSAEDFEVRGKELGEQAQAEVVEAQSEIDTIQDSKDLPASYAEQIQEKQGKLNELRETEEELRKTYIFFNPAKKKERDRQLELVKGEIEGINLDIVGLENAANKAAEQQVVATESLDTSVEGVDEEVKDEKGTVESTEDVENVEKVEGEKKEEEVVEEPKE